MLFAGAGGRRGQSSHHSTIRPLQVCGTATGSAMACACSSVYGVVAISVWHATWQWLRAPTHARLKFQQLTAKDMKQDEA
jgi:hypothetical protein